MRHIRVLVVGGPGLLHDIVTHAVASQVDMALLPETLRTDEPLAPSQRDDADVFVYVPRDGDAARADAALREVFRRRAVLAIQRSGERALLYDYDIRLAAEVGGDLSPEAVLDAIRRGAAHEVD